jgi:hypothetical protein
MEWSLKGSKNDYPLSQGTFWVVVGQYDPAEQNTSPLDLISAHTFAPPQVWFGRPDGN